MTTGTRHERRAMAASPHARSRRSRRAAATTLIVALLFTAVAAVVGADILTNLKAGGFDDPASDSVAAADLLAENFPGSQPQLVAVVDAPDGLAGSDAQQALADLDEVVKGVDGAAIVGSFAESKALTSGDDRGLILISLKGGEDEVQRATSTIREATGGKIDSVTLRFGGIAAINGDLNAQVKSDIILAESIAIPITLLLLLLVFRGVVAALIPVGVAGVTIFGSLAILNVVAQFTSVSLFAINLVTALGLGLAIDYCLLFLDRYRSERAAGLSDDDALSVTRRTTARTIIVSGVTVATALCTLFLFNQYFLRSFAIAGVAVVACTVIGAAVLMPASLKLLGPRIDWLRVGSRPSTRSKTSGFWYRVGDIAFMRPWLALPVIGVLLGMAVPFAHAQFGVPDERSLPASAQSRVVAEALRSDFPDVPQDPISIVTSDWRGTDSELADYAAEVSAIPGITGVQSATGIYSGGNAVGPANPALEKRFRDGERVWLEVTTDVVAYSADGSQLVRAIRGVEVPDGSSVLVGGLAAQMNDISASIAQRLPFALGAIAALTLLILFLFTGSVLLPIKALLLNFVGLVGILGLIVFIFQDGHLSSQLGFTASPIAISIPILLFCIAFGLSMDYEVFLLARIQERFHASHDLRDAVRSGLGSSGPVISAAAAILAVSFFAMATSGVSLIKMLGLGTGVAILIDAVLIRGILVPAFMRVAGRHNWWAPRWLTAVHRRVGLRDS